MNNNFSENIKKIRKDNNLSQEQLAEELGVSRQAISKWESGAAYPEMDKIITICKKYNVNIDDLLHKDIKEVKGEEETKNNINKYIEEFFKFLTDTVNLFVRMKFGSKLKLIFEECCIALVLFIICSIVSGVLGSILYHSPLQLLPVKVYSSISGFLEAIYVLVTFIICAIIMIRIFKARYLDYYESTIVEEKEKEKETKSTETVEKNEKIEFIKKDKVVIRDPKHSDYHFLKGLLKLFLLGVKFCALWFVFGLCISLVFVAFAFIMSFLVAKTGVFFLGCLLGCTAAMVALAIMIIVLFNFIFNRKSNKKVMIWTFVLSLIVGGMSIGMITIGSIDFDLMQEAKNYRIDTFEIDMNENTFFSSYEEVEYIPEERPNIKVEVEVSDLLTASYNVSLDGIIHLYNYPEQPMKLLREELKGLNEKKIYPINSDFKTIKVYASQTNIQKMKKNQTNYYEEQKQYANRIDELENEINEKEEDIRELQEKIYDLEEENERLNKEGKE